MAAGLLKQGIRLGRLCHHECCGHRSGIVVAKWGYDNMSFPVLLVAL